MTAQLLNNFFRNLLDSVLKTNLLFLHPVNIAFRVELVVLLIWKLHTVLDQGLITSYVLRLLALVGKVMRKPCSPNRH